MVEALPSRSSAPAEREPVLAPVRRGAELVHLAEELHVRIFGVCLVILLVGCGLALLFATLEHGSPGPGTALFVAGAAILGAAGLERPRGLYRRLRSRPALQLAPAALAAAAVLLDGPESQCWWIALPLLWTVAVVGSTSLAVGAAAVTGMAFLAGTVLGGQAVIDQQDAGVLPAAIGLPAYTMVGRVLVDGFTGLVLGRHHLAGVGSQPQPRPLRVPNLAGSAVVTPAPPPSQPAARRRPRPVSRLTARQLEVTLLLRDGLRQTEIAACLAIPAGRATARRGARARRSSHDDRARGNARQWRARGRRRSGRAPGRAISGRGVIEQAALGGCGQVAAGLVGTARVIGPTNVDSQKIAEPVTV